MYRATVWIQPGSTSSSGNAVETNSRENWSRFAPTIVDFWSWVRTATTFVSATYHSDTCMAMAGRRDVS